MDGPDDNGDEQKSNRAALDQDPDTATPKAQRLRDLLEGQYEAVLQEVREVDEREPDPPNDLETDYRLRDEGRLAEGGLEVFLSGSDGKPVTNSWAAERLLARAAAAYKLTWTNADLWAAFGAEQLQTLTLLLIRDHRPDLYKLPPQPRWTRFALRRLVRKIAFVRVRDLLASDEEALKVLLRWPLYSGCTLSQLTKRAIEGRKLMGAGRQRGRPRKFAPKVKI